jgi:hypothetical protein
MNHYDHETPPPQLKSPSQLPQPPPTNKYVINKELIWFSSQRIKMPFEKMKRGDNFWVIVHNKLTTKFQEQQNIWHTSF